RAPIAGDGLSLWAAFVAGDTGWNEPRLPAGGVAWLTTGRAKVRGGGAAVPLPKFPPIMVVRVGRASTVRTAVARFNWFGGTLTAFLATCCEFTSVFRETAVNPFRTRMFA